MNGTSASWPAKHNVFGIGVTATHYTEAVERIVEAARTQRPGTVSAMCVHVLTLAARNPEYGRQLNTFDMVVPDGQPVRWSLNVLHRAGLSDRVYGPELTLRVCAAAESQGLGVYFYGSTDNVLEKLSNNLKAKFPRLNIAGMESPPFRALTAVEDAAVVDRINSSGAKIVFIGIGCPKQEAFAFEHRNSIHAVQLCVGAAFDFHAGTKKIAPPWMQKRGLEWLFRLVQEPRRLWKRYFVFNSIFLGMFVRQMLLGERSLVGDPSP
jgi:N-acetylglucosaminyldiphosphoundecaprenol N-acetyl-beta-D-mannosaminyltransferase